MLCSLHTHYPWSLDLFIHVPFQLPFGAYITTTFSALGTSCTHCHLCPTKWLEHVLIYTWVKWSTWGRSTLPKSTTSKQWCPSVERNIIFICKSFVKRASDSHGNQRLIQSASLYPLYNVPPGTGMSLFQFRCLVLFHELISRECIAPWADFVSQSATYVHVPRAE